MENGFEPGGVLTFRVDLSPSYTNEKTLEFYRTLLARIDRLPRVASSGSINRLPVADREMSARIKVDGAAPVEEEALPFTALATVSTRYFDTLRVPLRRGRGFTDADFDASAQPVAIVSEDAGRRSRRRTRDDGRPERTEYPGADCGYRGQRAKGRYRSAGRAPGVRAKHMEARSHNGRRRPRGFDRSAAAGAGNPRAGSRDRSK
jgi:hypothetical protein